MEVHKVTLMIIDFDRLGAGEVKSELENVNYPNDCVHPRVMKIETVDIGEWEDENPLNNRDEEQGEFARLFPNSKDKQIEELQLEVKRLKLVEKTLREAGAELCEKIRRIVALHGGG